MWFTCGGSLGNDFCWVLILCDPCPNEIIVFGFGNVVDEGTCINDAEEVVDNVDGIEW